MRYPEFIDSLDLEHCPDAIDPRLQALWFDAKSNWHRAQGILQELDDRLAALIHAYLHRKEGDDRNSRY